MSETDLPRPAREPAPPPGLIADVVASLRRHWRIAALVAIAVTLTAGLLTALLPKRYEAVSIVAVTPLVGQMDTSEVLRSVDSLDRRVVIATVAALAATPRTTSEAHAAPGDHVDSAVMPATTLFSIRVEAGSGVRAAALANAIPRSLDRQTRAMFATYGVSLVSPALVPPKPSRPRVERAVMAGLVGGLVLGAAIAYLLDRRRLTPG